jgi:hypothetical protein
MSENEGEIPRWKREYERDRAGYQARQRKYYAKNRAWIKNYRVELRKEVVAAYGGACACCGEGRWQFLTIDHPNGDGQADRAKYRMILGQLYGWLKKNGFPKTYRILCMNCNWVQRFTDVCPHESERLDAEIEAARARVEVK